MPERRLILSMSASIDGFLARQDHEIDWLSPAGEVAGAADAARHAANLELVGQISEFVAGRRAYEDMAPAWSGSDSPMAQWPDGSVTHVLRAN